MVISEIGHLFVGFLWKPQKGAMRYILVGTIRHGSMRDLCYRSTSSPIILLDNPGLLASEPTEAQRADSVFVFFFSISPLLDRSVIWDMLNRGVNLLFVVETETQRFCGLNKVITRTNVRQ